MPYKKKEDKAAQMRRYRTREKVKAVIDDKLLETYKAYLLLRRREREEMLEIIRSIGFIVSQTDLTEHEKLVKISNVPISHDLAKSLKQLQKEVKTA